MAFEPNDLIEKMKTALRTELTEISFNTWIEPLQLEVLTEIILFLQLFQNSKETS